MNLYHTYRRRGRRNYKKGKWIIILIIITFAMIKIYKRNAGPASTLADESNLAISIVESDIEDNTLLTTPTNLISEPNLHQRAKSSTESNFELVNDEVLAPMGINPARIIEIRTELNKTLSATLSKQHLASVKEQLSKVSEEWLFSRTVFPGDRLCSS